MESHTIDEYQIGIICALPKELKAIRAIFDQEHAPLESNSKSDDNNYILGRVGRHNVVAAGLPAGVYGKVSAVSVAKDMLRTFTHLRFGLLVGIAGGIPDISRGRDIRLGDVVVGQLNAEHGGVVQYDRGALLNNDQFVRKGILNKPPQTLLTTLSKLQSELRDDLVVQCLKDIQAAHPLLVKQGYCYQGTNRDQLHCAKCDTSRWWWILWMLVIWLWPLWRCERCERGKVVRFSRYTDPVIHYSIITSGDTLLRNATKRDQLAQDLGALCVETEAAGLDNFPCLIIRGICDYSDAYKNDIWQEYAALVTAAFAKVLLQSISPGAASRETRISQVVGK